MSVLPVVVCDSELFENLPKILNGLNCSFERTGNVINIDHVGIKIEAFFDGNALMFVASRAGAVEFIESIIEKIKNVP